jgi:DNA mismatch repair protein MutS
MTPMVRQYRSIKERWPGAILFFRLGDFYEMFYEDAEKASRILNITLTSREGGKGNRIPMCGIPYHSAQLYINRLIKEGLKVAICEQVEDPKFAKGIVKREVIRIITPGTNLEEQSDAGGSHTFICAACERDGVFGLSCLDLSTGFFRLTEFRKKEDLLNEIMRLEPREIIHPVSFRLSSALPHLFQGENKVVLNEYEDWIFDLEDAKERLKRQFQLSTLEGLGLTAYPHGISAAGAIIYYLKENLHFSLEHLRRPAPYSFADHMVLDYATQRNLEIITSRSGEKNEATLLSVLDQTVTSLGTRLLTLWLKQPLLLPEKIRERQDAGEELSKNEGLLVRLRSLLKDVRDVEKILGKVTCGYASARDLLALKDSLKIIPEIKGLLVAFSASLIRQQNESLNGLEELVSELDKAIVQNPPPALSEGGFIRNGYCKELDELLAVSLNGKEWIRDLQVSEAQKTGIKSLKVRFNKVFGYYIEVTNPNLPLVPDYYQRKQTLVNCERFTIPELKEYEDKILGAEDKAKALEQELFEDLRQRILKCASEIQENASALATLDCLASFAWSALRYGYVRPEVADEPGIMIEGGRHPVVERMLGEGEFIENNTLLDTDENQLLIITGPNMAGKSTYIRQVALICLMAQTGSFVPAQRARIGVVDRIFTRIGASDNLARGESTFMVEMIETANILNNATPRSLIVLDEIGRGTSTFDGISIAWAVCEFLNQGKGPRPRTLFATHYHELTELEEVLSGVKNYNVLVKESGGDIVFLRKIVQGGSDRSYGIHVGKLAGLPPEVIFRAQEVLRGLEKERLFKDTPRALPDPGWSFHISACNEAECEHPVLKELREITIEQMTPLQALLKLKEIKEKAEGQVLWEERFRSLSKDV